MSAPDFQATRERALPSSMSADELARAVGDAMYEADACSRARGFELEEVSSVAMGRPNPPASSIRARSRSGTTFCSIEPRRSRRTWK